jgi:Cys-tRNA(Pro)/Cys-tRNA(Cys) deacylase
MSTQRMSLITYLQRNHVWFNVLEKRSTVHTAEAAAATGLPLERVIKSLVLTADDEPMITIIPGTCRLDKGKLKATLGVRNVHIVSFAEAERYSGYPPGATPPVYHTKITKVVIDQRVMQFNTVYGGGGSRQKLIEIKPIDIQRLNNALIANIAKVAKQKSL